MAAKELFCDPCSQEDRSNIALKYCSECEEHLCEECTRFHARFKTFKSHYLIDLSAAGSRIPSSVNMRCEIHTDTQLDFYCSHHHAVCCRACTPDSHSSCKQVYPLEIEFLKEHGSNNQLFLAIQKQIPHTQKAELKLQKNVSSVKEIDIKFERNKTLELKSIGSIEEITRPCDITYTTYKSQQAQVQPDTVNSLTEFKPEGEVQLKSGEFYNIRGIAVTADNKLLLCNYQLFYPKVYIYKDCKAFDNEITLSSLPYNVAVIPCSHTAVVTLPQDTSVQFINTANNTKERKINIRVHCWEVTASKDRIYLAGDGTVHIYGTDGSKVTTVTTEGGLIFSMHYNGNNDQILIRQPDKLRCIDLNGKGLYQYTIPAHWGIAVDRHSDVYMSGSGTNDIHRLSSDGTFRDIVLKESDGVKHPSVLSFNRDFTKLFIVSAFESVLVYNCK